MARLDPLRNFRFRLEIDNIEQAGFSEVRTGDNSIAVVDYREGTDPLHVRKLPGLTKYGNITLKRGITFGSNSLALYKWFSDVASGQISAGRKTVVIVVQDETGEDQARFVVTNAWPLKYEASNLDAIGNEVLIEMLELANEGIERVK